MVPTTGWQRDKAGCRKDGSQITASAGLAQGLEHGGRKEMGSEMPHTHRHNGGATGQDQKREEKSEGACKGWGLRSEALRERMNKVKGNTKKAGWGAACSQLLQKKTKNQNRRKWKPHSLTRRCSCEELPLGGKVRLATQSCPTLCDPKDCSPPGSSVHGILQARRLEWVAMPFSRGSSPPRVSWIAGRFFTVRVTSSFPQYEMGGNLQNLGWMQTRREAQLQVAGGNIPDWGCSGGHLGLTQLRWTRKPGEGHQLNSNGCQAPEGSMPAAAGGAAVGGRAASKWRGVPAAASPFRSRAGLGSTGS